MRTSCVVLFLLITAALIGFFFSPGMRRYALDSDRISGCMADMSNLRNRLTGNKESLQKAGVESIGKAVEVLVEQGFLTRDRLYCRCNGQPYRFRGFVRWLEADGAADLRVIAYEPFSFHHPDVGVLVLFSDGSIQIINGEGNLDRLLQGSSKE